MPLDKMLKRPYKIEAYNPVWKEKFEQIHKDIHDKHPFSHEHFEIWLDHLYTSIDENFNGPNCDVMKKMSLNMATVMRIKFFQ